MDIIEPPDQRNFFGDESLDSTKKKTRKINKKGDSGKNIKVKLNPRLQQKLKV